jgi:glycosyltransferase involved in cell wall biosynthesis
VLCSGGDPMPNRFHWTDPYGTPVRIFGRNWPERWRPHAFALGVAWTLLASRGRYQLVYFLMQGLHLAAGLPVARVLSKPVLMKISGSSIISEVMSRSWLGRLELRWLQKWAERTMILNSGMAEEALAAGFTQDQLFLMPNPVDVDQFAPNPSERVRLRQESSIPPEALVILFVGRLAPEKELRILIRAFSLVRPEIPSSMLIFIGDGPDRAMLESLTSELGLNDSIRFVGRTQSDRVRSWLQAADAFALVSSNEGFSCSLLEAMSTALPSIVSDIPANTQLIEDGVNGLVTKLRDEKSIASAIVRLFSDASLRETLGQAARRRVLENYSMDKVIDLYEGLFASAIGPRD